MMMVRPIWELMNIRSKYTLRLILFCIWLIPVYVYPQTGSLPAEGERGDIRILFYNTENYFDIDDDTLTNDNEFLPDSEKKWNLYRYREKSLNLFKTIAAVGETRPPEIICFAEIENKSVLYELVYRTPLEKYDFEIVHFDSPDRRGIDVGLIFQQQYIKMLAAAKVPVIFPFDPNRSTRDILHFKAMTQHRDTFHLFVNHWPSRMGGKRLSDPYRMYAGKVLRDKTDSILKANPCANIIITGDFNDEPMDESLLLGLSAVVPDKHINCSTLYNLAALLQENCKCGSYRYKSQWNMLDQFIISGNLLMPDSKLRSCIECVQIAKLPFLLENDNKYGGSKPYRTYRGPVYIGGFSDHLPVYLDLFY